MALVQMELVLEEQVELKGFQVQEGQADGVLEEEAKERHVDSEHGRQLEDVEVDWDTEGKIYILYSVTNPKCSITTYHGGSRRQRSFRRMRLIQSLVGSLKMCR